GINTEQASSSDAEQIRRERHRQREGERETELRTTNKGNSFTVRNTMAFLLGMFVDKPEFVTVLNDKQVEAGANVILRCEVNTTQVTVTWKKNGQKLNCLEGKHKIRLINKLCCLEIQRVEDADEGSYTLEVSNKLGSVSCSAMVTVVIRKWREIPQNSAEMVRSLRSYQVCDGVSELRFLLHGPIGAGKSSVINTIKTIFENRPFVNCLAGESGESFTLYYEKFTVGSERSGLLPFAFYDVMGLEEGQTRGAHTEDIIKALKGHIPNNYKFQNYPITEDHRHYNVAPTLNDRIHCLVSVLPADKISLMENAVIEKMKCIRRAATELRIPQMVFMTRVDNVCKMTKDDVSKVYQSKKIKEKMQECSNRLGVPMNCIFPVETYHEQNQLNEHINCLILDALTQIVFWANDYAEKCSRNQNRVE
ncbi:hypothetical protein AOLI_G00072130, partial [Acnodon oligacanthus]